MASNNPLDPNLLPPEGDALTGSAADVEAVMRKYDRESNTRIWEGRPKIVVSIILAAFSLFCIYVTLFANFLEQVRMTSFMGLVIIMGFLTYPAKKGVMKPNHLPWYDIVLMLLGAASFFFYTFNAHAILNMRLKELLTNPLYTTVAVVGILVLAELCRRSVGLPILCVAIFFIAYTFINGKTLSRTAYEMFYGDNGILGTPVSVCSKYIVVFIIFGAFLEKTGVSSFFINLANSLTGRFAGGPAKVAVISSALCGMVSGSSVGNTVTTGSVTIPMMKKTGYPPEFAGAVEAASSTGGQIMPPIMGAAAFLMAEMVGVPYKDIIVRAILPAFLYFLGIFLMVHFMAKKLKLHGIPREQLPKGKDVLPKIYLILPLVVLVYMIMVGFTMATAAVYAILYCLVVSMISREKGTKALVMALPLIPMLYMTLFARKWEVNSFMGQNGTKLCVGIAVAIMIVNYLISKPNKESFPMIFDAFENGGKNALSVAVACGMAGIIAGVVTMTGLGQVLISAIVKMANGRILIALVLTMFCCIVLGMGVPTTANYIIMATTCAPILGPAGMGLELMAAHMFCFYFGIVADITPPVALAAYAGSAIAKAPPMKTAFNATRLAIAAFIIPYIFAFNPAMLFINTTVLDVVLVVITSTLGMLSISLGMIGYFLKDMAWPFRILCVAGGLLMIYPGTVTDLIGIAILVAVFLVEKMELAKKKA